MTPLERAARALHNAAKPVEYIRDCTRPSDPPISVDGDFVAWEALTDRDRTAYMDQARAVIEAIREPI